ncbi:MAG: protein kinase domain-containing protein [Aggregatilineales bacterium]
MVQVNNYNEIDAQGLPGYEVKEVIGEGGFGKVYRAYQPAIQRDVAIKVIRGEYSNQPEFIHRFEKEAQLVARLAHPFIVPLFDYWRNPNGAYLVMRLLPNNLRDELGRRPFTPEETLRIIEQISSALSLAHRNNVIHRDIKPDNILLDEDGNAYLTDFGIAKIITDSDTGSSEEGTATGSLAYMSPEQLMGMSITPQSDVYAMGVLLHEILMGSHPFAGLQTAQIIYNLAHEPLPDLSPNLEAFNLVIQQATEKETEYRYETVDELAAAFHRALMPNSERSTREIDATLLVNPYKGLRPFDEVDAGNFYGREDLIQQMMRRMTEDDALANFLAVVGPSGSGKSSVVRAGLIPRLRIGSLTGSGNWYIADMMPGDSPIENLQAALLSVASKPPENLKQRLHESPDGLLWAVQQMLPDSNDDLLLVIDQFEEVFTMGEDEAEREQFLRLLSVAVTAPEPPLRIIVTLRADFYDRPLRYEGFGSLMQKRTQVVLPLSTEELHDAIARPATTMGMVVEPGMIEAIIADLRNEPGALPLLQYALTEVFERRDGNRLTLNAYRESGGVSGALARRAQEVFDSLTEEQQGVARQIVLRLVSPGEGTEDTRRRASRAELLEITQNNDAIQTVLDAYGQYRLLTFDVDSTTREPTVEVAHEAIIREWQQLRVWLNENRDDLRMQRLLNGGSMEWIEHNRSEDFLFRGVRLAQFEDWHDSNDIALTVEEQNFLSESFAHRERIAAAERARRDREAELERRSRNRLRVLFVMSAIVAIVGGILTLFAINRSRAAEENFNIAAANAEEARTISWAASSQLIAAEGDLDLAGALANEAAVRRPELTQVQQSLYDVLYLPGFMRHLPGHSGAVIDIALSPDEQFIVTGGVDAQVIIYDAQTFEPINALPAMNMPVTALAISPDSTQILVAAGRFVDAMPQPDVSEILIFDMAGNEAGRYTGLNDSAVELQFSDDGSQLFVTTFDGELLIFDTSNQQLLSRYTITDTPIFELSLSPDESQVAVSSFNGQVTVHDVATGEELVLLEHGLTHNVNTVLFISNEQLLTGSTDNRIRLWNISADMPVVEREYTGHSAQILSLIVDSAGERLFSGDFNGSVLIHNLDSGQRLQRFSGEGASIYNMRLSPDERTLITVGETNPDDNNATGISLWSPENAAILERLTPAETTLDFVTAPIYLDDNHIIAGTSTGRILDVMLSTGTVETLVTYDDVTAIRSAALSPDGQFIAFGTGRDDGAAFEARDNPIIIWSVAEQREAMRLNGHTDAVVNLAYSPATGYLVSGALDNNVRVWDMTTGDLIAEYPITFEAFALSPDTTQLMLVSQAGEAVLLDLQSGEQVSRYPINAGQGNFVLAAAWHPDADKLVISLSDGAMIVLNPGDGTEMQRFGSRGIQATALSFSPDGERLISTDSDAVIRIRDSASGDIVERRDAHRNLINNLVITDDGRILSSALDGELILWRLESTLSQLLAWAADNRSIRELTCTERAEYGLEACVSDVIGDGTPSTEMGVIEAGIHRGSFEVGGGNVWIYEGTAGEVISLRSAADNPPNGVDDAARRVELNMLDTRMNVYAPDGSVIADNDDIATGTITDSQIENLELPVDGSYRIDIRSFDDGTGSTYTLYIGTNDVPMPTATPLPE